MIISIIFYIIKYVIFLVISPILGVLNLFNLDVSFLSSLSIPISTFTDTLSFINIVFPVNLVFKFVFFLFTFEIFYLIAKVFLKILRYSRLLGNGSK